MEKMNSSLYRISITALASLGLIDALYLSDMALTGSELTCTITGLDGCNVVAQSVYSQFLGLPLAVYGVMFYSLLLLAIIVSLYRVSTGMRRLVFMIALAGAFFSTYFMYLQFFVIKALCIYCMGSAFIAYILAILTWLAIRAHTEVAPV
jgi:uncharacterized membrane protein